VPLYGQHDARDEKATSGRPMMSCKFQLGRYFSVRGWRRLVSVSVAIISSLLSPSRGTRQGGRPVRRFNLSDVNPFDARTIHQSAMNALHRDICPCTPCFATLSSFTTTHCTPQHNTTTCRKIEKNIHCRNISQQCRNYLSCLLLRTQTVTK